MLLRRVLHRCIRHSPARASNPRLFSALTIPLESLGDSITTAVLIKWSKSAGEAIKTDDVVAVVETDKVTMDIRAKTGGTFLRGFVAEGAEIAVGAHLYEMDDAAAAPSIPAPSITDAPAPSNPSPILEVKVPVMGESITTGMLATWFKNIGDSVTSDDVVASIETDKVTVEVRAPSSGTMSAVFATAGSEVSVGEPLFAIATNTNSTSGISEGSPAPADKPPASVSPSSVYVEATASKKAASAQQRTQTPSPPITPTLVPAAPVSASRSETRVKMTRMRMRISQRLKQAQNTAAMLTTFQEVDMSALMEMRGRHKEAFEKTHAVKLGFMSAFVKASTAALLELPAVNAIIDDETNEIVYRSYVDVSVAVASSTGLVVPVLRNTEKMSFADIEKQIAVFGKKAKEGSLALEEMSGGTFTISNGGVFGSLLGTPIINPPQSAILGMHATKMRPVVVDGQVVARPMMYLALTYDHRLIDGREAVTFLKSVASKIEDPARLLLEL